MLITSNAEAVCGTWNPIVVATATGGAESASSTISWSSAPPSACSNPPAPPGDNWGRTNKLTLRRAEGSTPPSTANSGTLVANMDVTGPTDVSSVAVDDQDANAPHVFFYPTDWSLSLGNRMGLYYSEAAGGSVSKVYYTINDSTGWPTGALNDPASWATAEWYVIYWDGATWGDQVPIDFFWDGSISGPSHDCIENVSAVVHVTGGTARSMASMASLCASLWSS